MTTDGSLLPPPLVAPSFAVDRGLNGEVVVMELDQAKNPEYGEVLTPEGLARYLGCGRTFACQLLKSGTIPSAKVGKLRRVRRRDVEQFLERRVAGEADHD